MSAPDSISRTFRLRLVDARDDALRALREFQEADQPSDRVRNELAVATHIFELELDLHAEQKLLEHPAVVLHRDWSVEQCAERAEELLELFDELGYGRLI